MAHPPKNDGISSKKRWHIMRKNVRKTMAHRPKNDGISSEKRWHILRKNVRKTMAHRPKNDAVAAVNEGVKSRKPNVNERENIF